MDLWIRTQNKEELIQTNRFFITKYTDWEIVSELTDDNVALTLGHYKTKERALEVLDEIQKLLMPKSIIKSFNIEQRELLNHNFDIVMKPRLEEFSIQQAETIVYEMPKE